MMNWKNIEETAAVYLKILSSLLYGYNRIWKQQ
jgi:hypothetical protein